MTRKVTCSNAQCHTAFTVEEKEIGDFANCPRCGTRCTVLAEFGDDFDISTITPPEQGARMHHPARQICTNCGAVLGVRAAFCPRCNADVRTGAAVIRQVEVRKRDLRPILIGAGAAALILIAVIVLIAVLR